MRAGGGSGAEDGIRTRDLRFTKPLLYQLSYFGLTAERGEHATRSPSRKPGATVNLRLANVTSAGTTILIDGPYSKVVTDFLLVVCPLSSRWVSASDFSGRLFASETQSLTDESRPIAVDLKV